MLFKKTQLVVGGVGNDTGISFSHSMFAFSLNSRVTQKLPGKGEDWLCKCLYILELPDCSLRWAGTDQVCVLTASNFVTPTTLLPHRQVAVPKSRHGRFSLALCFWGRQAIARVVQQEQRNFAGRYRMTIEKALHMVARQ